MTSKVLAAVLTLAAAGPAPAATIDHEDTTYYEIGLEEAPDLILSDLREATVLHF